MKKKNCLKLFKMLKADNLGYSYTQTGVPWSGAGESKLDLGCHHVATWETTYWLQTKNLNNTQNKVKESICYRFVVALMSLSRCHDKTRILRHTREKLLMNV